MYKQKRTVLYVPSKITTMKMGGISTTQLELGLEEHVKCQCEVLKSSDINIKKRKRQIRYEELIKKVSKAILPIKIYERFRYTNRGWIIKS